jgi:curved DNA-binding protein CbpA
MRNLDFLCFFNVWLAMQATHYELLNIPPTASESEIHSAYRRLAKKIHPDRNLDENATQIFQQLGSAYATLKDPVLRKSYDASLRPDYYETAQEFCNNCEYVDMLRLFKFFLAPFLEDNNR